MKTLEAYKIVLTNFLIALVLQSFLTLHSEAACTPKPDMKGTLVIESCEYKLKGLSLPDVNTSGRLIPKENRIEIDLKKGERGILLKGVFTKTQFIPSRQTNTEPFYRRSPPRTKIEYDQLENESALTVFYQSTDKKICTKFPKGKPIEMRVYFYCCELRPNHSSPCAAGADYYTEGLEGQK